MDARSREPPQSHRSGIKRHWGDDTKIPAQGDGSGNGWHGGTLPPIEAVAFPRHPVSDNPDNWRVKSDHYTRNGGNSVVKRSRYEGSDYNGEPRVVPDALGKMPPSQAHYPTKYDHDRTIHNTSTLGQHPRLTVNDPVNSPQDMSNICRQCRRQVVFDHESLPECCEHCQKNPELALVAQACSIGLTQLAETLRSGIDSEKRGINPAHSKLRFLPSGDPPPIIDFGLKQTLHWIVTKINKVNELADKFVQQVPPSTSKASFNKDVLNTINGGTQYGSLDIMKRRIDDDHQRFMLNNLDGSDSRMHQRRRSVAKSVSEELPPIRTQSPYHHIPLPVDNTSDRLPSMNHPPGPARQLPSPPGRAFPSPTSANFSPPSESASHTGSSGAPSQPLSLHASSNVLRPITNEQLSDSALRMHTAALQHEVSIQKIALSSLQGEHDKLLAALSRSQSRASALEKKHQVSDIEIFSLTEEKARLNAQVLELEGDIEDLSKSRDTYRQAAVQEGAQYVEIVKMASQLEEKTGEERKNWNKMKLEMERRIEELSTEIKTHMQDSSTTSRMPAGIGRNITSFNEDNKHEGLTGITSVEPTSSRQLGAKDDLVDALRAEIERLRERCEEVEAVLRAVRQESRLMESIVEALGRTGRDILQKVESVSLSPKIHPESQSSLRPELDEERVLLEE
ncbi:22417993-4b88-4803-9cdd-533df5a7a775 [Sclerotinia trifoliorum]|uniref:22417993-4b88-4803-9cdd-533df5a7a775 n=1 Tax=Sclerotinia trifoliorum TaxID=28548 RepID=A0A8H2W502_9HELO|nr:22417993-4b88-4803-9cdd-533df5a7a775 [Sclerotinia trifoliorum]